MVEPDLDEIVRRFRAMAETARPRAPLYARLSAAIADDPSVARVLLHAPPAQRMPVLLFACVHWLLLDDATDDADRLRAYYPNLTRPHLDGDPFPAFRSFCARHDAVLAGLLATRSTQTNEVGRCALLIPALGRLAAERGELAVLDVGASAGLNLLLDRYRYRYDPAGGETTWIGDRGSEVVLACGTRGPVPLPEGPPTVVDRLGLDREPVDLRDEPSARWLEACVWPDQADRFDRLRAAIAVARADPPTIVAGDAVRDLAAAAARLTTGHRVVLNTWALNYLALDDQRAYVAELDAIGASTDLSWVIAESPSLTPGLPWSPGVGTSDAELTHLAVTRWRSGERSVELLATCHPHGFWLHWRDEPVAGRR